jgi:hypothetical protein
MTPLEIIHDLTSALNRSQNDKFQKNLQQSPTAISAEPENRNHVFLRPLRGNWQGSFGISRAKHHWPPEAVTACLCSTLEMAANDGEILGVRWDTHPFLERGNPASNMVRR